MLKDLRELFDFTKQEITNKMSEVQEVKFSDNFQELFKNSVNSQANFFESTVIVPTSTSKVVVAPALWFYVSSYLTSLLEELNTYKERVKIILLESGIIDLDNDFETWADDLRKGNKDLEDDFIELSIAKYGEDDSAKIKTFLTDYNYWGGGKSIGRSQNDFAHSVLLRASGLLNESSGYISSITSVLLEFPDLKKEILNHSTEAPIDLDESDQVSFDTNKFKKDVTESGLNFSSILIDRFVSSLCTKPFVILTGLSGSGKTKLAQAFTQWISKDKTQYCIVPVGADWTNREPLLGFPNALDPESYVKPDNDALNLIINANKNRHLPYFLILDEMNLSHVERYFADFLSIMESNDSITLHKGQDEKDDVPSKIKLPPNLFIIGTVNIDETTYMFSPKVLDRANAIEFRISEEQIKEYLEGEKKLDISKLEKKGIDMAKSFLDIAANTSFDDTDHKNINKTLVEFFSELKKTGAEFGYRSASEIYRLIDQLSLIAPTLSKDEKTDIAIMQKLLPKLHGSRRKLCPVLITLGKFCIKDSITNIEKEVFEKEDFNYQDTSLIKYSLSLEKIARMYKGAIDNGFASYAEA